MKQNFDGDRALYTLTLGEFFELLNQHLDDRASGVNRKSDFPTSTGRLVFGGEEIQVQTRNTHKLGLYVRRFVRKSLNRLNINRDGGE